MPLLPPRRSARWLLVLLGAAALLAAGLLWADSAGPGTPAQDTVLAIVGVSGLIAAVLTALGAFGGRATFACAMLGLLIGLARMIWAAEHPTRSMEDLAAIANFYLYGVIGLGIGALIDFGRWLGARQRRK